MCIRDRDKYFALAFDYGIGRDVDDVARGAGSGVRIDGNRHHDQPMPEYLADGHASEHAGSGSNHGGRRREYTRDLQSLEQRQADTQLLRPSGELVLMRKIILFLIAVACWGQGTLFTSGPQIPTVTVSALPSAASTSGQYYGVTDACLLYTSRCV